MIIKTFTTLLTTSLAMIDAATVNSHSSTPELAAKDIITVPVWKYDQSARDTFKMIYCGGQSYKPSYIRNQLAQENQSLHAVKLTGIHGSDHSWTFTFQVAPAYPEISVDFTETKVPVTPGKPELVTMYRYSAARYGPSWVFDPFVELRAILTSYRNKVHVRRIPELPRAF